MFLNGKNILGANVTFADTSEFANALKGTASGAGMLSLADVSPLAHKIKIKCSGLIPDGTYTNIFPQKNCTVGAAIWESDLSPNVTYTLSFECDTVLDDLVIYTNGGAAAQYSEGKTKVTADGRQYITFTTDDYVKDISCYCTPYPNEANITNVCIVEGRAWKYCEYGESYTIKFDGATLIISGNNFDETISLIGNETKEVEIRVTGGTVTITPDSSDVNIEVEYNRDIAKAITALENAVGLVNTTLASVVEVEE